MFELGINKGEAAELVLRDGADDGRFSGRERRLFLGEVGVEVVDVTFAALKVHKLSS